MEPQSSTKTQLHTIWSEKRIVALCLFIALAQFQYGYDSAAVSGFQSMPGFLAIFGYVDVSHEFASLLLRVAVLMTHTDSASVFPSSLRTMSATTSRLRCRLCSRV